MAFRMEEFVAPNWRMLGDRVLVLEHRGADRRSAQAAIWLAAERVRSQSGVVECVPGMNDLTVLFEPERIGAAALRECIEAAWQTPAARFEGRPIEIPVRYGGEEGPDLDAVAQACGLLPAEVIALHCEREYVALFLGFQPGFAYLGEVDARLRIPRRASPRARVAAGSVAIAADMTAVYPFASPGGWNVIGRTSMTLFDPNLAPASRIVCGDRVRFLRA